MAELLLRGGPGPGPLVEVTPRSAGWTHVGFAVHRVAPGDMLTHHTPQRECCVVVLTGAIMVRTDTLTIDSLGGRASVFDGLPAAVYVPAGERCEISGEAEIALCTAPATAGTTPAYAIEPAGITVEIRGSGAMARTVHPILMGDRPASALLVVEVLTPGGHWSSYPPHKHDVDDPPHETRLEETYYHRIARPGGYGLQRVYTADREIDESIVFADGDVVLVPRGYHTVSMPPGYDGYYLNVMAGPLRAWAFQDDPAHTWLRTW